MMIWETELEAVRENARISNPCLTSLECARSIAIRLDGLLREVLKETFGFTPKDMSKGKFARHIRIELYRHLFSESNKRPENKMIINSGKDLTIGEIWALDMLIGQETARQTLAEWMVHCGKLEEPK